MNTLQEPVMPRAFEVYWNELRSEYKLKVTSIVEKHFGNKEHLGVVELEALARELIEETFHYTNSLCSPSGSSFIRYALDRARNEPDNMVILDGNKKTLASFVESKCQLGSLTQMLVAFLISPAQGIMEVKSLSRDSLLEVIHYILSAFMLYFGEKYIDDIGVLQNNGHVGTLPRLEPFVFRFNQIAINYLDALTLSEEEARCGVDDAIALEEAVRSVEQMGDFNGLTTDFSKSVGLLAYFYLNDYMDEHPHERTKLEGFMGDLNKTSLVVNMMTIGEARHSLNEAWEISCERGNDNLNKMIAFAVNGLRNRYFSECKRIENPYQNTDQLLIDRSESILTDLTFGAQVIYQTLALGRDLTKEELDLMIEVFELATWLIGIYNDCGGALEDPERVIFFIKQFRRNHSELSHLSPRELFSSNIFLDYVHRGSDIEDLLFTLLKDSKQGELNLLFDSTGNTVGEIDGWKVWEETVKEAARRTWQKKKLFFEKIITLAKLNPDAAYLALGFETFNESYYLSGDDYDTMDEHNDVFARKVKKTVIGFNILKDMPEQIGKIMLNLRLTPIERINAEF